MENQPDKFIAVDQVAEMFGIKKTSVYAWEKAGRLPRRIKLTSSATRWSLKECVEAQEREKAARAAGSEQ
jgi:predicted DNA-binding transcriptional regulator AlpA